MGRKEADERHGGAEPRRVAGGGCSTDDGSGGDGSDPVERCEFGECASLREAKQDRGREEQGRGFDGGIDCSVWITDQDMK